MKRFNMPKTLINILFIFLFLIPFNQVSGNENWSERGLSYLKTLQYEKAIEAFSMVLKTNPDRAEAYNNRGIAWYSTGQYDRALDDYNRALEIDPRSAEILSNRGIIRFSKGNFNLAINDYDKALGIDPQCAKAYTNRGAAWFCKGQYELAVSDYIKALEIDPNCSETHRQLTWIQSTVSAKTSDKKQKEIQVIPKNLPPPFAKNGPFKGPQELQGKIIPPPRMEAMVQKPLENIKQLKLDEEKAPRQPSQPKRKTAANPFVEIKEKRSRDAMIKSGEKKGPSARFYSQKAFSIQIGAFASKERADRLVSMMKDKGYAARLRSLTDWKKNVLHTVRIGEYTDRDEAKEKAAAFTEREKMPTTVRPTNEL